MRPFRPDPRPAFTLPELLLVLGIVGLTTMVALRQLQRQLDHLAARNAVAEAANAVARARDEAVAQHTPVSLRVDTVAATLELRARSERLAAFPLGSSHGVRLATTRDSIAFDVRGLGYGAANLTLVVRRGAASETLVVSRLGRVRY
jgi:prepilin-type N-terminal cleavage/methylation domain-containing protein